MFSSRFDWTLQTNRIATLLRAKRASGAAILDLTESNPTRAGFQYPQEIVESLANNSSLIYEPSPAGLPSARAAVSRYYGARGLTVGIERILLTASTSEAYSYLFKLLADPGDEVLVPQPSYPLFGYLAAADSVHVNPYSLVYHGGWMIDFDSLARAVTPRARALIVVNPNNPTGSFLKRHELEELITFCAAHDLALISDEVFSDYAFAPDEHRIESVADVEEILTFSLSGLSKTAGLPQMKLGWIVVGGPPSTRHSVMERLELIADSYLSVATPVQHALPQLLEYGDDVREQIAARVHANLDFLRSVTEQVSPCHALTVEGGWYATLQIPRTATEEDWCLRILSMDDVLVQPGFFYDFQSEAFLILSLITEPAIFQEGVERLETRVARGYNAQF